MADAALSLDCPNCQSPLHASDQFCTGCGLSLDTLTFLLSSSSSIQAEQIALIEQPEAAFLRLGEYLIQRGLLTEAQLAQSLARQSEVSAQGEPKRLGEIVVEMGFVSSAELQRAIADQILMLQEALAENSRLLSQRVAERTAQLEQTVRRMSEINQLKTNFIATISHELRTPLAQMQGFLSLFSDGVLGPLPPKVSEAVARAYTEVLRLRDLIENLVRFVSVARGELALEHRQFRLDESARKVLKQSALKAAQRGVTLVDEVPPEAVWARGDFEKLGWALAQLMDNGIKFTPEGGQVGLRVSPAQQPGRVRVTVWDSGEGIAPERIPELFQPLRRVGDSSTGGQAATGLGLVLVGRIVAAHNGQVQVESSPGQGSALWFDLPQTNSISEGATHDGKPD